MARRRFEIPGWVLIVLMTTAVGVAIWAVWGTGAFGEDPAPDSIQRVEIAADEVAFDKARLELKVGVKTLLEFNNNDTVAHVFRADDFSVHLLVMGKQQASMSFTPEENGTFDFRCDLHPKIMTGTISVKA